MSENVVQTIRVHGLRLHDFKNVEFGEIDFHTHHGSKSPLSDVCGIYGQNGSGKTAVINAFKILKFVLGGRPMPQAAAEYIRMSAEGFTADFTFQITDDSSEEYLAEYSFYVRLDDENKPVLQTESLHVRSLKDGVVSKRRHPIFQYDRSQPGSELFSPKTVRQELLKGDKASTELLRDARAVCASGGSSFLFSSPMKTFLSSRNEDTELARIALGLWHFVQTALYVVDKWQTGFIFATPFLPIAYRHFKPETDISIEKQRNTFEVLSVRLDKPALLSLDAFDDLDHLLHEIDNLISAIIPDLHIEARKLGETLSAQGEALVRFELVARRGDSVIPFYYESSGIRRLVSILGLLVYAYNDIAACVVIDELDAGVFEYLLGEILAIFAQSGAGQLIFTSHNLRPLELLHNENLVYTTTDPANRYASMRYLRSGANKREAYYENIVSSRSKGIKYYNAVSRGQLELAFGKAWKPWPR